RRVCLRKQLELVETDWHDLLGLTQGAPQVA
ncbi:MAG: SIR2 family protein, partial [Stutzerimonas stutzeri]